MLHTRKAMCSCYSTFIKMLYIIANECHFSNKKIVFHLRSQAIFYILKYLDNSEYHIQSKRIPVIKENVKHSETERVKEAIKK